MMARTPGSRGPDDDADPSVRLVDALTEDAAREAAANPGPPSDAARALSRFARARFFGRSAGSSDGVVQTLGSDDGEQIDTGRILAMDRVQLVAALTHLQASRGLSFRPVDESVTDDQLRGELRALRPRPARRP